MRYLLDELSSQETSHHDALSPIQKEASKSFNGDHLLTSPATSGEVRHLFESVERQVDKLRFDIENGKLFPSHLIPAPSLPPSSTTQLSQPPVISATSAPPTSHNQVPTTITLLPPCNTSKPKSNRSVPPFPNATIPNIKPGRDAWREAIKHWEDPHTIPNGRALKDWPLEWYTGGMSRFTGSKYTQRKDIANEFIRYVIISVSNSVCIHHSPDIHNL